MRELLGVLGLGFVSSLVPVVNIETVLGIRAAVAGIQDVWLLSLAAAVGQVVGKLLWYYLGANALSWGWIRRKAEKPKNAARLETWRRRTHDRPVVAGLVLFLSATSGVPPLAILSVLAGQLKMPLWLFCSVGLLGRWVRFAAVLGGGEWLGGVLS